MQTHLASHRMSRFQVSYWKDRLLLPAAHVVPNLEITCRARGFDVIFLPKYHCELNFIEQCWGHAKHIWRQKTCSLSEAALEHNVIKSLSDRCNGKLHFASRSIKFIDAYHTEKALKAFSVWAIKKYRSHR
ncbi:hypothetical protein M405DRAFT_903493, partial [Rhizopogon salebrosus TDB-379]